LVCFDYSWIFYFIFLAEPPKLSIFSYDICFDFRLNHKQNKKNLFFLKKRKNIDNSQSTERIFSMMKIVKIRLRNRMEDDFLANYLIVYIEKEITERFTINMIIDDFYFMKERRAQLK
jgi:hypothetical protein